MLGRTSLKRSWCFAPPSPSSTFLANVMASTQQTTKRNKVTASVKGSRHEAKQDCGKNKRDGGHAEQPKASQVNQGRGVTKAQQAKKKATVQEKPFRYHPQGHFIPPRDERYGLERFSNRPNRSDRPFWGREAGSFDHYDEWERAEREEARKRRRAPIVKGATPAASSK